MPPAFLTDMTRRPYDLEHVSSEKKTLISLVIPVFNEQESVPILLRALGEATARLPQFAWELVLVDDGSRDNTVATIEANRQLFGNRLVVVRLSRNFGHQPALAAGLARAEGDAVICLDADLQDPPDLFEALIREWQRGHDVVYAIRKSRRESVLKRLCYGVFYRLLKKVGNIDVPLDAGDFGLMSRRVVNVICGMPEQDVFLRGLRSWVGFKQTGVPYDRPARCAGDTKYSFVKLVKLAASAFFGYSLVPLRLATMMGLAVVATASFYFVWGVISKLVYNNTPPGWASLVGVISFLSGAQLVFLGILGEYVGRIYAQTKGRPLFVVAKEEIFDGVPRPAHAQAGPKARALRRPRPFSVRRAVYNAGPSSVAPHHLPTDS